MRRKSYSHDRVPLVYPGLFLKQFYLYSFPHFTFLTLLLISPLIHLFLHSLSFFMKSLFSLGHLIIAKECPGDFISTTIASLFYNLEQTSSLHRSAQVSELKGNFKIIYSKIFSFYRMRKKKLSLER